MGSVNDKSYEQVVSRLLYAVRFKKTSLKGYINSQALLFTRLTETLQHDRQARGPPYSVVIQPNSPTWLGANTTPFSLTIQVRDTNRHLN